MGYFKECKSQAIAVDLAETESKNRSTTLTVIKSRGEAQRDNRSKFYVEEGSPFIRSWETVIGVYTNGIKEKE